MNCSSGCVEGEDTEADVDGFGCDATKEGGVTTEPPEEQGGVDTELTEEEGGGGAAEAMEEECGSTEAKEEEAVEVLVEMGA